MNRGFQVHTIGNTVVVLWSDDGLARRVSADTRQPGATYAREAAPGVWHSAPIHRAKRITFTNARMLAALVRRMILDDTMPKL